MRDSFCAVRQRFDARGGAEFTNRSIDQYSKKKKQPPPRGAFMFFSVCSILTFQTAAAAPLPRPFRTAYMQSHLNVVRHFHACVGGLQRLLRSDVWRMANGIRTSLTSPGPTTGLVRTTRWGQVSSGNPVVVTSLLGPLTFSLTKNEYCSYSLLRRIVSETGQEADQKCAFWEYCSMQICIFKQKWEFQYKVILTTSS